jgi:hypothetical protein
MLEVLWAGSVEASLGELAVFLEEMAATLEVESKELSLHLQVHLRCSRLAAVSVAALEPLSRTPLKE